MTSLHSLGIRRNMYSEYVLFITRYMIKVLQNSGNTSIQRDISTPRPPPILDHLRAQPCNSNVPNLKIQLQVIISITKQFKSKCLAHLNSIISVYFYSGLLYYAYWQVALGKIIGKFQEYFV